MDITLPTTASLLGLPAELRIAIFECALENASVQLRNRRRNEHLQRQTPWSIIHINRQTRAEALPLFYRQVRFDLLDGFTNQQLRDWLAVVGDDVVACMRKVVFECKAKCSMYGLMPELQAIASKSMSRRVIVFGGQHVSNGNSDSHAAITTDYCHRKADLDMSRDTWSRLQTPIDWLCSNKADGCWGITADDVSRTDLSSSWTSADRKLQASDLIAILQALTKDNNDSAA